MIVEAVGTAVGRTESRNPGRAKYIQDAMVNALKKAMGAGVTDVDELRRVQVEAANCAREELRLAANS